MIGSMPHREILWNVPSLVMAAVYVLSGLSGVWILFWFFQRSRLWAIGELAPDQAGWLNGIKRLAGYLLTHRPILRDRYAGLMHLLVFWGFALLLLATMLVGIQHHFKFVFLVGPNYLLFSLLADLGGLAFCIGIGMALWRRRSPPAHGRLLRGLTTTLTLWLLLVIGLTGFLIEAARIAWTFPPFERWSPVGYVLALILAGLGITSEAALPVHLTLWIAHAGLVIAFFVLIPITFLKHLFLGAYSVMRPAGTPGLVHEPATTITSAVDLAQFRCLDLLQADACLTCGWCTAVCPAHAAGKPLNPRSIVLGLRDHLDHAHIPLTQQISDNALWSCTACHACDAACPINIHVLDKIVTLRRGRVAVGDLPNSAAEALESTAQKFNPFGRANSARLEWASGMTVPVAKKDEPVALLYWVGCAGAFDPAGREVARAMIRILNHLKIAYYILGCRERCTGDPARRLGEEGLWRELAKGNSDLLSTHQVQTILTHCPHCFHSFKNEYSSVGPMPQVVHHSQWLQQQLAAGVLKVRPQTQEKMTYHDPCYLGRANGETAAPRHVLDQMFPQRTEMTQHGANSFCCGGGGGQIWLDVRGRTRVETIRAGHVEEAGASTVATGCPFCRVMLEAGRAGLPEGKGNWRVKDIAELVAENLIPEL